MTHQQLLQNIIEIAKNAGKAILEIYQSIDANELITKEDGSPLTQADIASHHFIVDSLKLLTPMIAIISEESEDKALDPAQAFWLVDPLDGTKEFINRNGEFTVNIALIEHNVPVLGVVYAPALDVLYAGMVQERHAFKMLNDDAQQRIEVALPSEDGKVVLCSRSHSDESQLKQFMANDKVKSYLGRGSSLKFCLIAEGKADLYPRLGRTMEWDTAAGHAVLAAAGGKVLQLDQQELKYGKQGLENPHFCAFSS